MRSRPSCIDVVLCDLKMPKVDGVEVLKFIKSNFPGVEVVMLTGISDVRIAVECMKLGAYDFVTKPTTSDELLSPFERALERRQLLIDNVVMKGTLEKLQGQFEMVGESDSPSGKCSRLPPRLRRPSRRC